MNLQIDTTQSVPFVTADRKYSSTEGTVTLRMKLKNHHSVLTFHVIENLSHDVIIGYPALRRLVATIDTANDEITFHQSNERIRESPTYDTSLSSQRLPVQSHTLMSKDSLPAARTSNPNPSYLPANSSP